MTRILVVDDEPQLLRALATNLRARGYEVDQAATGEAALTLAASHHPDLVVLDLGLPGIDGLEVIAGLRGWSSVPIVVLSVREREADKVAALDAGADDYVTKPFSMPELSARIRANLRRVPSASHAGTKTVRFGTVSIDLATHHLSVSGTDVRLTPKQFDVLAYLIDNPNVSIPHARLLQAVWGPDYRDEVEYLHVVINQLRKRIEVDPSHPRYIITEPWFGYRFQLPEEAYNRAE
jgi:two-component system KDP operon response regulator KdpE